MISSVRLLGRAGLDLGCRPLYSEGSVVWNLGQRGSVLGYRERISVSTLPLRAKAYQRYIANHRDFVTMIKISFARDDWLSLISLQHWKSKEILYIRGLVFHSFSPDSIILLL